MHQGAHRRVQRWTRSGHECLQAMGRSDQAQWVAQKVRFKNSPRCSGNRLQTLGLITG